MKYSKLIILFIFLSFFLYCHKDKPSYIFLITLDTTRADAIDYTPGNARTPNLASLASKGINFRNAYSTIPITLPSHASMFYSLYPHDLKLYNNGQINNTKHPSLAQLLKRGGFGTGAVISLGVLTKTFSLNRGFDSYFQNFPPYLWTKTAEQVNRDIFRVINNLKGERSFIWGHYSDPHSPYFPPYYDGQFEILFGEKNIFSINNSLYFHFKKKLTLKPGENKIVFRSTMPSQMKENLNQKITGIYYQDFKIQSSDPKMIRIVFPSDFRKIENKKEDYFSEKFESVFTLFNGKKDESSINLNFICKLRESEQTSRDLYMKSISYMDKHIGELIGFLKQKDIYKKSIILIIGDHGEGMGDYQNHFGHVHYLNKVFTNIPFIITGKDIRAGEIRKDLVSTLDIAPTILDIAGIKPPEFMKGSRLLSEKGKNKLILETFSPQAYFDAFSVIEYPHQILFYPGRIENRIEYIYLEDDQYGINTDQKKTSRDERAKLLKSILGISRSITATKGKIGKRKRIQEDILKSLGYL